MSLPSKDDHYAALRVQPSADAAQIKAAYRALVREFHPDANPHCAVEAEARIKEITEAYRVLGDSHRRAQYDLDLRSQRFQPQKAASSSALLTRVRVALQLSADECAARLGMAGAALTELEARDAVPSSPVQSRTFLYLLDCAATALEQRGDSSAARELRLDLERKRGRQAVLR